MGFDQSLRDGQAQAGPALEAAPGVLAEQMRQLLRRHAPALVGDRDGHVDAVAHGRDPDGGGLGSVAGGVGEKIVENLDDALPVGQDPGEVQRQVDEDGVPAAAAEEGVAGLVHQDSQRHRLGRYRQSSGLDAARVQQVADQAVHVIGLLVDDAEKLAHHGRIRGRGGVQHGGGRALDGDQRGPQLVADQAEELGP